MTSIDAAIIKALVEHIGGNPDDIPDGGLSFSYEPLPSTFTFSGTSARMFLNPKVNNKLDTGLFIPGQTVFRLKRKDSDIVDSFLCTRNNLYDSYSFYSEFKLILNDNPFQLSSENNIEFRLDFEGDNYSAYISPNSDDIYELPSNDTSTGFYKLVIEGETGYQRTLRQNLVSTQQTLINVLCALMGVMRSSDVDYKDFVIKSQS